MYLSTVTNKNAYFCPPLHVSNISFRSSFSCDSCSNSTMMFAARCFPTLDLLSSFFISSLVADPDSHPGLSLLGSPSGTHWVLTFWWMLDNSKLRWQPFNFSCTQLDQLNKKRKIHFWSKVFKNFKLMDLWHLISWLCYIIALPEFNKCDKKFSVYFHVELNRK